MREMIWLVRRMALSTFKNYKLMLLYLCLPVLGIALASSIYSGSGSEESLLRVGVVNHDDGQAVPVNMVEYIRKLDQVEVREVRAEEAEGLLANGHIDALLTFPKGFAVSMLSDQPTNVGLTSVQGSQVTAYIKSYVNAYIENLLSIGQSSGGEKAKFDQMYTNYLQAQSGLSAETVEDHSVQHRKSAQTVGYLIVLMLFSAVSLSGILLKEKENRTYFRVFTAPVTGRAYVAANIIVNLAVMLIQVAVTLVVMTRFFHMDTGIPVIQMFLLLGLFALVAVSLALAIVAFSSSSMVANGIQTMVIIPTCLVAGCLFPITTMPTFMQQAAQFLPQYWLLDTVSGLQHGEQLSGMLLNLAILLAFALVLALTAAYKFGRNREMRSFI
ncbi:ABC transporter permease [Paenibacillus sp. NPDC058071]|uniref:ABC transporter permease n=1 Tax=Paenibacillus sp. NPDC058071 TaxID=3346326 RepID=UPI0036DF179B